MRVLTLKLDLWGGGEVGRWGGWEMGRLAGTGGWQGPEVGRIFINKKLFFMLKKYLSPSPRHPRHPTTPVTPSPSAIFNSGMKQPGFRRWGYFDF